MLSVLVFLPLVVAVLIILLARDSAVLSRNLALGGAGLTALVALVLVARFNVDGRGYQFSEHVPWLPQIGASYHIGMDGVSLLLVVLTVIVTLVALLMSRESVTERVPLYMALIMLLETGLLGVYLALDLVLFYLFWEAVLIPLYLLIGMWGGRRRTYAAFKYVLYTMVGSMLMLAGVVGLYVYSPAHTFDIPALTAAPTPPLLQMPLLIAFGLASPSKPRCGRSTVGYPMSIRKRPRPPPLSWRERYPRWACTGFCASRCPCSPWPRARWRRWGRRWR